MSLKVDLAVTVGSFDLQLAFVAEPNTVTAVVGQNGAGKTTLLRCIAGELRIDQGTVSLDEETLDKPPTTFVVPERRHVGVVYQDVRLFPHLSALENVAFGLRSRGLSKKAAGAAARLELERLGASALVGAKPADLSGGEAQRVALARALAGSPKALLLDEPLSAVDAVARKSLRQDLQRRLAEFSGPIILVTHDPADARTLASDIVVIDSGRIVQAGTVDDVTTGPRTQFVAELFGGTIRPAAAPN